MYNKNDLIMYQIDVKICNTVLNSETVFNTESVQIIEVAESSKIISLDSILQAVDTSRNETL